MGVKNISLRKRLALELFRIHKQNKAKLHPLSYLFWECTLRCNLSCQHCGSDCRKIMQQKDMPLGDFLNVIDQITPHVNTHKTMIVLTGGEPLLREDLEICGYELYKREYPWGIVTNGLELTDDKIKRLLAAGMRAITISLDGLEKSHNRMRRNNHSFQQAFHAIQTLVALEDEILFDVVSCITQHTFHELAALKELLIEAGVKRWRIFTVFPIGRAASNDELQLTPTQFKALFDFIKESRIEKRIQIEYGCEGFLGDYEADVRDNFFFCRAGISVGSILVDGSISACPNLRSNLIQGNIYKDNFIDIWNNKYQKFRDRKWTKQGECKDCHFFRYCLGNGMHLRDDEGKLLFCHLKRIEEGENHGC